MPIPHLIVAFVAVALYAAPALGQTPKTSGDDLPSFSAAHTRLLIQGRIARRFASTDSAGTGRTGAQELGENAFSRYESIESRTQHLGAHFVYAVASGPREVLVAWPEYFEVGDCVEVFTSRYEASSGHYAFGKASLFRSKACQ